jgi:hypothetical protein
MTRRSTRLKRTYWGGPGPLRVLDLQLLPRERTLLEHDGAADSIRRIRNGGLGCIGVDFRRDRPQLQPYDSSTLSRAFEPGLRFDLPPAYRSLLRGQSRHARGRHFEEAELLAPADQPESQADEDVAAAGRLGE